MLARAFSLALLALAVTAPIASASLGDHYVPDAANMPGVDVTTVRGGPAVHFGPKAAKLYRAFAGRRVTMSCSTLVDDDGWYGPAGGVSSSERAPRRRSSLSVSTNVDVCAFSTKRLAKDAGPCIQPVVSEKQCIRVVVALTDAGRAFLDQKKRGIELFVLQTWQVELEEAGKTTLADLQKYFGTDVVELPSADASPPPGKVGYFNGPNHDVVTAALLADGRRVFLSWQTPVFSTNVPELMGPSEDAFSIL